MKLHGVALSNFYNVAKMALLEKDIQFEEVAVQPNQDAEFLAISPMGKIPVLEVDGQFITESEAIIQFLELYKPDPPLFPKDAFAAARATEVHHYIDLYLDIPARKLFGAAFFGGETTPEEIASTSTLIDRGVAALNSKRGSGPFFAGDSFSHADIAACCTLSIVSLVLTKLGAPDPLAKLDGLSAYKERMHQRESFQIVMADSRAAMAAFMTGGG